MHPRACPLAVALIRLDRFSGFLVVSALLVALVSIGAGVLVGRYFQRHHLEAVTRQTAMLVSNEARNHLRPEAFNDVAAGERADVFRRFLGELPGVFRIKVFGRTGRIVWSDEPRLLGRVFPDNPNLARALRGEVATSLGRPQRAEHVYERTHEWVSEVYVPITFPEHPGVAGVIEAYHDATSTMQEIHSAQTWILLMAGLLGLALWGGFAMLVSRTSVAERRAIARLESQNRELAALQRFAQAVLEPRDLRHLASSVVECAATGLGMRHAALYRVGADHELVPLAHWTGMSPRAAETPKDAPVEAITTRRPVVRGSVVAFPLFTAKGGAYLFIGEFADAVDTTGHVAVRVLEVMLQAAQVALANVELFTDVREAHEQVAAILAGVTDPMVIIDRRMRLLWTNAPSETGAVGQLCYEAVDSDSCEECPGALAFLTGKSNRGRLAQRMADGRVRHLDIVAAPLRDGSDYVHRVLEVARDITDLVEMEERLTQSSASLEAAHAVVVAKNEELVHKHAELVALQGQLAEKERLAAVGEVVVSLHHAILNPLAGVAGAVAVLRDRDLAPAERQQVFAEIDAALRTIEEVVRRLQTLRRASGTPYVGHTMMLDLAEGPAEREGQTAPDA